MKFRHPLTSILCITTMVLTTGFTGSTTVYAAQTNDGLTPPFKILKNLNA